MRLHFPWTRAVSTVTLAGALAAAGCGDDGGNGLSVLLPSEFPGTSVDEGFLGDDLRAFSNSRSSTTAGSVQVFRNVSNDDAIVIFQEQDASSGHFQLMASWWNGSTFSPPVEILGDNENPSNARQSVKVLFLETSAYRGADSTATSNGKGRDGDAIITYVGQDSDDPASADRDANRRAYATYFDRSVATKAAQGTIAHGFNRLATVVDFDHVLTSPEGDASVEAVGFVSDSLHGTHAFDGNGLTLSGDPTSFVNIAFRKSPSVGTTFVESRWFTVAFDLGQQGNAIVPQAGATDGLLVPAVGTQANDEMLGDSALVVHNGFALWEAERGNDRLVTASVFAAGAGVTSINLGSDPTADDDFTGITDASHVYGPDHGVGGLYVLLGERGFSSGANGSRASDVDLMAAQVDVGGTTRAIAEIDNFKGTILAGAPGSAGDMDSDGLPARDGTDGSVNSVESRVLKNGGAISVLFSQSITDATDANDSNATIREPHRNLVVYAQVIQTNRPSSALASSVLAAPVKAPALESTGSVVNPPPSTGTTQANVANVEFQTGLVNGLAATWGGPNTTASLWQTNPNRVWFRYTQFNDRAGMGTVPNQNRLFVTGLDIVPGADASTAPTATLVHASVNEALVPFPNTAAGIGSHDTSPNPGGWNLGDFDATLVDSGAPAGEVWTFFNSNDNNVGDATVMGAYRAVRLYVWDGTATTQVSSTATSDSQQSTSGIQPYVVGKRLHVFWQEAVGAPSTVSQLATRSFTLGGAIASVPALGTAPSFIDLPSYGRIQGYRVAWSGSTVGVFIQEDGHVYYNQTTSDAAHYRKAGGLSDPTLVDNDTSDDLITWDLFWADGDKPLRDSFLFWSKVAPAVTSQRLQVRVHD
ncbi:MAG: hypothetical protein U0230_15270 [Polyangiales bacterium]